MSSKIKVDTIENVAGSGNVSLGSGHNLVVPGNITGSSNATVGGTLLVGSTSAVGNANANELELTNSAGSGTVGMTFNVNSGSADTGNIYWRSNTSNNNIQIVGDPVTNYLAFATGGTERARFSSTGLSFATGHGIDFTNAADVATGETTTSSLLDDYEEGTFTPSVGGNATYNSQIGKYVKIGRSVTIKLEIHINSIGTGSTSTITGIPYASDTEAPLALAKAQNLSGSYGDVTARIAGATLYYMTRQGNVASAGTNTAIHGNGTLIQCSGSYVTGS